MTQEDAYNVLKKHSGKELTVKKVSSLMNILPSTPGQNLMKIYDNYEEIKRRNYGKGDFKAYLYKYDKK